MRSVPTPLRSVCALAACAVATFYPVVATAAAPTNPPAAAASAASAPPTALPILVGKERPTQSPAVRAAEGALEPGKLRPENAVVPQIAVPLRSATKPEQQPAVDRGARPRSIDERAASCAAHKSQAERQKCMTRD